MAKRLIKNTEELFNFARDYRIDVDALEHSVDAVSQALIEKLMTYYDEYYMYIDNGKQMKEAQERNREIEEEVAAIKKVVTEFNDAAHDLLESMDDVAQETVEAKTCATCKWNGQNCLSCQSCGEDGISNWEPIIETEKENVTMTENKTTTNNNTVQEELTMKTKTTFAERILNMGRIDRILYVYDALRTATKNTDEAFIKKDDLAQFMYDNDLIGRQLSKTEVNKTKRNELVELFNTAVDNLIKAGVIKPLNTVAVEEVEDATQAIQDAQLKLAKQACEEAIGHSVGTMEFYLAVLNMYNNVQEARKQAAAEIDHAKVNTVNETPKAEPKTENKPAMPISQSNVTKESEALPNTVAETKYQFNVAQCSQVIGRILMDSAAQEVFGTISDHILRSHIASVLFNKTMNVMKNGKFTKEKTKFSEYETGAINEFITRLLSNGYIKLNESKASYSLSDAIKDRKGVWKHEASGTQYIVDYKKGVFAKRGGKDVYKLSDYKVFKDGTKKLNRYVLQDTCVFQGLTPVANKENK